MVGMDKTVTLYCAAEDWQGREVANVSVTCIQKRQLTPARDKAIRRRVDQSLRREQERILRFPASSLPLSCKVQPGDLILFGPGPARLESPSQPKREGLDHAVIRQVQDRRREKMLPHMTLICT